MKSTSTITLILITGIFTVLSGSCKKDQIPQYYLENKYYTYINQLYVSNGKLWVLSSIPNRWISFLPVLPRCQVSVTDLETGEYSFNNNIPSIFTMSTENSLTPFLATYDRRILKLNDDLSYEDFFRIPVSCIVNEILCRNENDLFVATYSAGIYFFNGTDTVNFTSSTSVLKTDHIPFIAADNESNVWLMQGNCLYRIDKTMEMTRAVDTLPLKYNQAAAGHISADKDNTLWVSKWDGYTERIYKKTINAGWTEVQPPESSSGRRIRFIRSDSRGTIWIAYGKHPKDILAYYDSDKWNIVDIPVDEINILDVDTYKDEIITGTSEGIYKIPVP
jgi:hypothetical protein